MPQCPDIQHPNKVVLRQGLNRWLIVAEQPETAGELAQGVSDGLDHFVGNGWSAARIKAKSFEEPDTAPEGAPASVGFPLPAFSSPVMFVTVEFNYSGNKREIKWPWLQTVFKKVCVGLVAVLPGAALTDAEKRKQLGEQRLAASKGAGSSGRGYCFYAGITAALAGGVWYFWLKPKMEAPNV